MRSETVQETKCLPYGNTMVGTSRSYVAFLLLLPNGTGESLYSLCEQSRY
jgi:hypothetical protein